MDLADTSLFINRELSQLEFNRRVLGQAADPSVPLLERLRFLTISCTNLDEFFEVRVAALREQVRAGVGARGPDGKTARETLRQVSRAAHGLAADQYRLLRETILPALASEGIRVLPRSEWSEEQRGWIRDFFMRDVLPVLTPISLDPAHPFPKVLNKILSFVVTLEGADAFGRDSGVAIVQTPRTVPRMIRIPSAGGTDDFSLISSVIHDNVALLFPGMTVLSFHQFRVTRDSDLWIDEEEADDLLDALKGELPGRHYGSGVRLEVSDKCPEETAQFLLGELELDATDLYPVHGPVNPGRLVALLEDVDRPDLRYPPHRPSLPRALRGTDPFAAMRGGDILIHHPYESFAPILDLVRRAAADPNVLAIKTTLYRTGPRSEYADALFEAARAGKETTVVVELRARFDEAANIELATRLQSVGAHVVYGVVGFKTHAKMMMIVRREEGGLRRYVHLGTGNYHTATARAYTDVSLLTADPAMGEDVHRLFQQLTGLGEVPRLQKLLQAPFNLHLELRRLIEEQADLARAGMPSRIAAKMNSLSEPGIIQALYAASQAGVPIDLVIRGVCCLRPGVPGISETIRVRSVVGRFLEHSRVVAFGRESPKVYCGSADWMDRNFFRRVETSFPILDPALAARVLDECIELPLRDGQQAWDLQPDGTYIRCALTGDASQTILTTRHSPEGDSP